MSQPAFGALVPLNAYSRQAAKFEFDHRYHHLSEDCFCQSRDVAKVPVSSIFLGCQVTEGTLEWASMNDVTRILNSMAEGGCQNAGEILPLVYEELRRLARQKMAREPAGHTLQPTALVHEAWLRVAGLHEAQWNSRAHFFSAAAEAMRRILVERARRRLAMKHGGGQARVELDAIEIPEDKNPEKLLRVHEALDELAVESPEQAEVVKLRFFVGMSHAEIANALNVSEKTSKRYWAHAKAWLCQRIKEGV